MLQDKGYSANKFWRNFLTSNGRIQHCIPQLGPSLCSSRTICQLIKLVKNS